MLHRSPTLSILHDMLQPNGLADSHHSFDHRERLWCAATAAPTASTRGRPAGRQQPRVMLLADVEIAGDVEIQPRWRVLLSCELGKSQKNSRRVRKARKNRRRRGSHCVALLGTSVKRSRQHALARVDGPPHTPRSPPTSCDDVGGREPLRRPRTRHDSHTIVASTRARSRSTNLSTSIYLVRTAV